MASKKSNLSAKSGASKASAKSGAPKLNRDNLTLALCIALFPPIWAVLSPYIGVQTGAVALICAGVYVANGNREQDALPMSLGFLAGDLWAVLALYIMETLPFNPDAELFAVLFVLGGLAVVISALFPAWLYCPAWLCGWAVGLTIMAPGGFPAIGTGAGMARGAKTARFRSSGFSVHGNSLN